MILGGGLGVMKREDKEQSALRTVSQGNLQEAQGITGKMGAFLLYVLLCHKRPSVSVNAQRYKSESICIL